MGACVYLWVSQAACAVRIQVKAVMEDILACWSTTSVHLVLFELRQRPDGVRKVPFTHISAYSGSQHAARHLSVPASTSATGSCFRAAETC